MGRNCRARARCAGSLECSTLSPPAARRIPPPLRSYWASALDRSAGRNMCPRRDPPLIRLELHAELVVEDPQITVAAAHHRRGHDRLHFLRHHADMGLVAAVVGEAV